MAEPIDISADVAPISPEAPVSPTGEQSNLSDEVLNLPIIQAVMSGAPPAISFVIKAAEKTDEAKIIAKNKGSLQEAGINFYRSLGGDTGVLFNSLKISGADIQAADKNGKLLEIAPDATQVSADILSSGGNHPALSAGAPNGSPAAPQSLQAPQQATAPLPTSPGPSAGQSRQRLAAMLKNLGPQAATSGANAGQGNLLRAILKPVI